MADYKVTKQCFVDGKRCRVGDIIKFEGNAPSYLKAIEDISRKEIKKKK